MKLALLFSLVVGLFGGLNAQFEGIQNALNSGNADALAPFLDNSVELAIGDDEDILSKAEAVSRLKTFFNSNKVSGFSKAHTGASKDDSSEFVIGHLAVTGGKYRVYLYMKKGSQPLIQELRFEKE